MTQRAWPQLAKAWPQSLTGSLYFQYMAVTPAEEGVYIHGLYLEGCRWDPLKRVLAESQPKVQLRNLPVLLVASYAQWN